MRPHFDESNGCLQQSANSCKLPTLFTINSIQSFRKRRYLRKMLTVSLYREKLCRRIRSRLAEPELVKNRRLKHSTRQECECAELAYLGRRHVEVELAGEDAIAPESLGVVRGRRRHRQRSR